MNVIGDVWTWTDDAAAVPAVVVVADTRINHLNRMTRMGRLGVVFVLGSELLKLVKEIKWQS
jgi:hypothetical protein